MNEFASSSFPETTPTQLDAIPKSFRCGRKTFEPKRGRFRLGTLYRLAIDAVPALDRNTILLRFLFGGVTFASLFLTIGPGRLENLAVHATPEAWLAIPDGFFFRRKAWRSSLLRILCVGLYDLPIGAGPAGWRRFATLLCFARGIVTFERFRLTFSPGGLDNLLIETIPIRPATLDRFFWSLVAFTSVRFTFGRRTDVYHSFETAIAQPERWRRGMTTTIVRARQRPGPTMGWLRRARGMISGRTVPLVGMSVIFPPPAASILFPNPLATGIAPTPAVDRSRSHQESMLVAVERNPFADNQGTVINCLGDRQDFEVTDGKVAKQIEVVHLPFDEQKGMFRIVARGRRSHDHAGGVEILLPGDAGRAGRAAKRA